MRWWGGRREFSFAFVLLTELGLELGMGADVDVDSAELAVGWFGDYDGYDLASLSLLAHGPPVSYYPVCD